MPPSSLILPSAAALLLVCHVWFYIRQPEPYMDELFHVPQAKEFCNAMSQKRIPFYDPSITTPPGLYLPNFLLTLFTQNTTFCGTQWLRSTSAVMSFLTLILIRNLLCTLYQQYRDESSREGKVNDPIDQHTVALLAFVIWLHPVNVFYANLYYTDTTSLFWIVLLWTVILKSNSFASAFLGVMASLSRQTNMVWHAYIVFDTFLNKEPLPNTLRPHNALLYFRKMMKANPWHIFAGVGYVLFIVTNGGVAIGDKSHHEVALHQAMFAYFLAFHGSAFGLIQLSAFRDLLKTIRQLVCTFKLITTYWCVCAVLTAMVLATGEHAHPFILADNRHFTFYVYRRWLLRSPWHRLCLVPVYGWFLMNPFLERIMPDGTPEESEDNRCEWDSLLLSDLALLGCSYVTLVSSALLEPRYFTVPSILFSIRRCARLKTKLSKRVLWIISLGLVVLNISFVYVFAELPFQRQVDNHMPRDLSPGRFMF
ncbi:Dol-P-Glc:Glc(2)Man(9)GlcNAc(2)-PP-Dol alpha-1,2-glucosyltransferase [Gracilariopsis chorda]|uniref:Dol-P-Glc:Glc(2)Man(9)GlcNAc(2)-PP-Dol alpha-1,2-glucosyltransferase n=1 Tax=Gracilariopsis chorda TaxID=448386 RepID=A0A2V3IRU8_9FLOR|nr:Dol-P-Glc:Glc(2)Man(9)GlcNAc(2)-PP-Dol alpha-1,2-glucosyltransferase [Gracilariopsis chorda]|eukprot:PXF44845.1 Dol-P-Glc:Glc(2)Man(9)GlcNAc(2)-PP-Dol alpha-1,2-glucosyltransferase [Gracilariopsis chorda]